MKCPKCGIENVEGAAFCLNCGSNLNQINNENMSNSIDENNSSNISQNTYSQSSMVDSQNIQQQVVDNINTLNSQFENSINTDVSQNTYSTESDISNNQNIQQEVVNNIDNAYSTPKYEEKNKKGNLKLLLIPVILVIIVVFVFVIKPTIGKKDDNVEKIFSTNTLIRIEKDNKYGYIDTNGNIVIEPQYTYSTDFYGNYAEVAIKEEKEDGSSDTIYAVIDKKGNNIVIAKYSSDIEYDSSQDVWIVNNQLYNGNMKKLSKDNVKVKLSKGNKFLSWRSDSSCGIMDITGKITYTNKSSQDCTSISLYNKSGDLEQQYCLLNLKGKRQIVNCNDGTLVKEYTDVVVIELKNNVFEIYDKDSLKFISYIYVQNNKIVHETTDKDINYEYNSNGYMQIRKYDNGYKYQYIDSNGNITNNQPQSKETSIEKNNSQLWEEYTGLFKYSCNSKYGLMKDQKVIISCNYSVIEYLDLTLYKFLKSNGKEYLLAKNDNKTYLLNVKNAKVVKEFNSYNVEKNNDSTFIYYKDNDTNKYEIYNLLTGKNLTAIDVKYSSYLKLYNDYITIQKDDKIEYYNNDLKLFYTDEK